MATDFTQDTLLHFLQSSGGSVKNSDLLQHFRNFIRDHADRDRNRELFKKFVNSVATVQQLDGVSYVVLRRKFKGYVHGGGERGSSGPPRRPAGRSTEPSAENARLSAPGRAEKPRQREGTTPAPSGVTTGKTILTAAGIVLNNNNNNVETNFNLKHKHQQVNSTPEVSGRPPPPPPPPPAAAAAAEKTQLKTPSLSELPAQDPRSKVGQLREGLGPSTLIPPVVTAVRHVGETSQQVPVPESESQRGRQVSLQPEGGLHQEPLRGRQVSLQSEGGLHQEPLRGRQVSLQSEGGLHQEPAPHHVSLHQEPLRGRQVSLQSEGGLHQEPAPHHVSLHQEPLRGRQVSLQSEGGLHQEPLRGRQVSLQPEGGLHQEPAPHHVSLHQEPLRGRQVSLQSEGGLHQEPLRGRQVSLQSEGGLHQEPLRGRQVSLQSKGGLHEEPPLHHVSLHQEPLRGRQVSLQPEGGLHEEPPHHISLYQEPSHHHVSPHQEPPPHHISPHQEPPHHHATLYQENPLHHVRTHQVAPRRIRHRPSYKSAVSCDEDEDEEEEEIPIRRGSAGGAWPGNAPLADKGRAIYASSPCIIEAPAPSSLVSSSSSSSFERNLPKIYIQKVSGETLSSVGQGWSLESGAGQKGQWAGPAPGFIPVELTSPRYSLPSDTDRYMRSPDQAEEAEHHHNVQTDPRYSQPAGVRLEPRQGPDQRQRVQLSSSHSSIFSPASDAGFSSSDWLPSSSPRGSEWNSSYEELQARTGKTGGGWKIQEVLHRAQRAEDESVGHHMTNKTQAPWHHSTGHLHDNQEPTTHLSPFHHSTGHLHDDQEASARVLPWHLSTGDLYADCEEAESSEGSASTPPLRQRPPVVRRLSSQLRSRMCRSLGANLDQLLQEEAREGGGSEAARLNRLHLISSSLSLHYNLSSSSLSSCSTPPRCHSLADLAEGVERKGGRSLPAASSSSSAHHEGTSRQSLVPLDPKEHAWLVKGAAGAWPDIYSLFRDDSSLLNRQDFISGFTVLHWIAKHGDHRVLNTLWYGVQKAGLSFDIDARSTCGQTPLHIAAIHGHKNIMRLLVSKFNANVKLRDTAGKKAWQYLNRSTSTDVFQLLGAPPGAAVKGGVGTVDTNWKTPQQQQRRRRRHHLSSASSGERPLTISGTARVKRSSSIAAFLKHKSMRRFHGHQSDSSI